MSDIALRISHVSKEYRLGSIGGATLRQELQSKFARIRGKDDPNLKIGQKAHEKNERFLALDDVSFEIRKGERVGILGHNGAGKSTLLKLICRVTAPSKGEICMNGRITSMLEVGTGFHGELTGRENVYLNGAILGLSKQEIDKKFDEIVEFSEVGQFIDTPVKRYSSGMHVKLGFAVASHLDSEIMIMDEVLAVGDMAFQKKCIDRMRKAAEDEGRTILYVSHNMRTIRELCSRCIVLDHGKVIFDGDTERAIEIYMPKGGEEIYKEYWVFSDDHKSRFVEDDRFSLTSFRFAEKNGFEVKRGTNLHFFLQIHAKEPSDKMFLRLIYLTKDDSLIGMTDTKQNGLPLSKGENLFECVCDTSSLAPGNNKLVIELCSFDLDGNEYLYESVRGYVYFLVFDPEKSAAGHWHRSWWGPCDFGNIELRKLHNSHQ